MRDNLRKAFQVETTLLAFTLGGVAIIMVLFLGFAVGRLSYQPIPTAEALNVSGGEAITRSETDADFTINKNNTDFVQVRAIDVNRDLRGQDKNSGAAISRDATAALQFLTNFHQSLAAINTEFPCPLPEDYDPAVHTDCDPDVIFDPARCTLFWEDAFPTVDHPVIPGEPRETLTSRPVIVTIDWDGTIYTLRLRDPSRDPADFPDQC